MVMATAQSGTPRVIFILNFYALRIRLPSLLHFGYPAPGHGLHHLAGILELLEEAVYIRGCGTAAPRNPFAAAAVDDRGILAFGRTH